MTATPKKATTPAKAAKKPAAAKPAHPAFKSMIKKAIKELKDQKGSSKSAIVKYISANYKVSADKVQNQTKLALRRMAAKKEIVHVSSKSTGASGSFKLPAKEPVAKKPTKKTSPTKKAVKKPAAKKASPAKQAAAPKKAKSPAKPKAAKKPVAAKKSAAKKSTPKKAAPAKKAK